MSKNKIIIILSAVILISLAIVFLPFPKRINTTLTGVKLTDTSESEVVELSIKGWYLNYLFRDDNLKGTVTVTPYIYEETNQAVYELMSLFSPPDADLQFSSVMRYNGALHHFVNGTIVFDKEFGTVLLDENMNNGCCYVASEKALDEVNDTIERFKSFLGK